MPSPVFLCPIWDEVLHERRRREGTHFTFQYLSPKDQNHAGGLICVNTNRQGVFILPAVKTLLSSFRAYFEFSYAQINPVTIYIYIYHSEKCVLLIVTSLGCLSSTVQIDACAEFYTRRLFFRFICRKFLCMSRKSQFQRSTCRHDFETSSHTMRSEFRWRRRHFLSGS